MLISVYWGRDHELIRKGDDNDEEYEISCLGSASSRSSTVRPAAGAEGVISKTALTDGSYCHLKFPAIEEWSLSLFTKHPVLKSPDSGDIIDFYGPCDHDPLGKDEIYAQLRYVQRLRDPG